MATLYPVAGCRIFIGPAMELPDADIDATTFAAIPAGSWTEIKNWETMGAVGDAAQLITTSLIDRQRDIKQKGTRNAGSMQNNFAVSATDPGQIALIAAEQTNMNYPFRIVGNDAPAVGGSPKPSERLFVGLVTSAQEQGGGANTVRMLSATVELNTNVVRVAPSAT